MEVGKETEMQLTKEELDELAMVLHAKMEHLDPTDDPLWSDLSEHQRDFYRFCVEEIVSKMASMRRGIGSAS